MIPSIITKQTPPKPFTLPDGYTLESDDASSSKRSITIPGQQLYGGADISRCSDAAGVLHMACCARGPDGDFRFRVFRLLGTVWVEVPLQARASGRGEISIDQYTGEMVWIAWEYSQFFTNVVPGAAPFVFNFSSPSYEACVPSRYTPAIDGQEIGGGRSLDMASLFDLPQGCRAYAVRLVVQAEQADVRARLGTETQPGQLTANTQAPSVQLHQVGIVNAGDGGRVWLSVAPDLRRAKVWLQVVGYWAGV